MNPQDNANGAPLIPSGTEKNVFGNNSFVQNQGQAQVAPVVNSGASNAPVSNGTTFAELAAKKGWTTVDQMAAGYANLESHNKKVEMTAADIIKAVNNESQVAVAPVQVPVHSSVQSNQAADPNDAAIQIVKTIVQNEVKPLQQTVELQQLFLNNPDAKDFAEGIAKAMKENPGINWASAYKLAKFDALEQKGKEQGAQTAYQNIQQKQTVMAGAGVPTQRSTPDVRSIIRDRSVPFREVDRIVKETLANMAQ